LIPEVSNQWQKSIPFRTCSSDFALVHSPPCRIIAIEHTISLEVSFRVRVDLHCIVLYPVSSSLRSPSTAATVELAGASPVTKNLGCHPYSAQCQVSVQFRLVSQSLGHQSADTAIDWLAGVEPVLSQLSLCPCLRVIRPKRIYFPEHFCYCFSSNLCVLNTTNTY
jgi:hypothetical protein